MTILAKVQNGVLTLPSDAPSLPEGAVVQIVVPDPSLAAVVESAEDDLDRWIQKHAGAIDGLPEDFAAEHDHYIHGTPRRNPKV